MFYPESSLRRGGRFYLCWVADSWPWRFSALTHRQIWSQDVRQICDDLMEVVVTESGSPNKRFSLRLSSQLMRGLVRLYHKQVHDFLNDLCMLDAHILHISNRRFEVKVKRARKSKARTSVPAIQEPGPGPREEDIVQIIQNSGNAVARIEDITLREEVIPPVQIPVDGFGEENPELAFQLMVDRTVEQMLGDTSVQHHSALDLPVLEADKSKEISRLAGELQMERISEIDVTMFNKSTAPDDATMKQLEFPPIPEPVSVTEAIVPMVVDVPPQAAPSQERSSDMVLEELEHVPEKVGRRRNKKMIIDKKIKFDRDYMSTRINTVNIDLRCQTPDEDYVIPLLPAPTLFRSTAHVTSRYKRHVNTPFNLERLFTRNAITVGKVPDWDFKKPRTSAPKSAARNAPVEPMEESELNLPPLLPPQLEPVEQALQVEDGEPALKKSRISCGFMAYSMSHQRSQERVPSPRVTGIPMDVEVTTAPDLPANLEGNAAALGSPTLLGVTAISGLPEQLGMRRAAEVPEDLIVPELVADLPVEEQERNIPNVSQLLHESGLADKSKVQKDSDLSNKTGSGSETPLGSLDRTKVSLGDSVTTTDSKKVINDHWGTEGCMIKILRAIKTYGNRAITVRTLVDDGPSLPSPTTLIAAKCFSSLLKLKQYQFIQLHKDQKTLEITNITLGKKVIERGFVI